MLKSCLFKVRDCCAASGKRAMQFIAKLVRLPLGNTLPGPFEASPSIVAAMSLGACRAWGVEAKIGPSEDSFYQVRRLIAEAMGQEAGEKWTAAVNLQPTFPKTDRLLKVR